MSLRYETLERCGVCDTPFSGDEATVRVTDPYEVADDTFTYMECANCGTWVLNPRPVIEDIEQFYEGSFIPDPAAMSRKHLGRMALLWRRIVFQFSEARWVLRHAGAGSSLLDYSAGDGQLLVEVKRRRPDLTLNATEFSETYRPLLESVLPEGAVRNDIDDFEPGQTFDLIVASGVLEHVYAPASVLAKFHKRLAPGGKLILSVPNPSTYQRALTGARWYTWLAPRHTYLMKMHALADLLERAGFRVVERKHFFLRHCSLTLVLSFLPSLNPIRTTGWRLLAFAVLFFAAIPLELAASAFGKSGFMGVVAVKADEPDRP